MKINLPKKNYGLPLSHNKKPMNRQKSLAAFSIMIVGLGLIACSSEESKVKSQNDSSTEQKDFRNFRLESTNSDTSAVIILDNTPYRDEIMQRIQVNEEKLNGLQKNYETLSENVDIYFLREIFYLKKENLNLKVRLKSYKGLSSYDFSNVRESLTKDLGSLEGEIKKLEITLD
jgi:hypothetical protein